MFRLMFSTLRFHLTARSAGLIHGWSLIWERIPSTCNASCHVLVRFNARHMLDKLSHKCLIMIELEILMQKVCVRKNNGREGETCYTERCTSILTPAHPPTVKS